MLILPRLLRLLIEEPKPRGRLRKRPCVENEVEKDGLANNGTNTIETVIPRTQLAQKSRTDHDGTSSENPLAEGLIRPAQKFAKSVTETSSKVQEPKSYN